MQSILPLTNNTAIKLTTARYYTPNGRSIQAKGITPDFVVEETPEGDLNQFRLREADLTRHLSNPKGAEEKPNVPTPRRSRLPTKSSRTASRSSSARPTTTSSSRR